MWYICSPIWLLVTKWRQWQILVAIAKALYPFILHFGGFWGIEEAYFDKYWRFRNVYIPWGQFETNVVYFFTYLATGDKLGTIGDLGWKYKYLYPFMLHFSTFWGTEEAYFEKYLRLCNSDPLVGIFNESAIFCHVFANWWQISANCRSWLHIQKDYIHWYFTLVDFGALRKNILTNIDDFVMFTSPGANL